MADTCTITIRDFLTDKHGFTLPASRLSSYEATIKHTHLSLFRNPKAFNVHLHQFLHSNDCADDLVDRDGWDQGEYIKEGHITLWAHFVRIPGVDLFGEPCEGEKALEGYSLPPPNLSAFAYVSKHVEITQIKKRSAKGFARSMRTKAAPPFPRFRKSAATRIKKSMLQHRQYGPIDESQSSSELVKSATRYHTRSPAQSIRKVSLLPQPRRHISESPLFEPEIDIKKEGSPSMFQDEGGIEWTDDCYGFGNFA
ncbi:hypothetical protein N0V90_012432 [Kalmusia sp. IMI 367209]|nr:hypothetical protein N0V90_012432 [Kalmusia sp. IMI 367209]